MGKKTELVVYFSDTHCGSSTAICPGDITLNKVGNRISHGNNHEQRWLWESWLDYLKWVRDIVGKDPYIAVSGGDLIEGIHHRNKEIIAADMEDHMQIACEVIHPIFSKATNTVVVKGTECHTYDMEDAIAAKFKSVGGRAHNIARFKVGGVLYDAAHHMPCTSRKWLEASALSIIATNNQINSVRAGLEAPQIYLRGHRHVGGYYTDASTAVLVGGAWKTHGRYEHKVVGDSVSVPMAFILDHRGLAAGSMPRVHIFRAKAQAVKHINI